ncbi:prepilin peptidase [Candidatus Saccharibacteria bacterium]|nr:prepilin peptidase [Candidatus Saccharibacteria bacterium]
MQIGFLIILFIVGACLGSFLCCQARRLHLKVTSKKGTKHSLGPRSVCLHCHYQLTWYDNIPILSWLILRGKCRKCHHQIGIAELLSELGFALAFFAIGFTIDITSASIIMWSIFLTTLILTVVLGFLAIYDGLYGELPMRYLILAICVASIVLSLKEALLLVSSPFSAECVYYPLLSVLILGGLYLVLYLVGRGTWVGDGDWLLATAIGLAIFHPWYALCTLFLSNFLALIVMFPYVKKSHQHRIYFGPFLVVAFIVSYVIMSLW